MEPASKVCAGRSRLTIRVAKELSNRLDDHREATGVPTNHFVVTAIKAALDAQGSPRRRKIVKSA